MFTEEEKAFMAYWEQNRLKEKRTFRQLLIGLPLGMVFTLPILANFISGWYKRADMIGHTQFSPGVLISAAVIIIVFFAIFSKRHRWDMQEQRYLELKAKNENDEKND